MNDSIKKYVKFGSSFASGLFLFGFLLYFCGFEHVSDLKNIRFFPLFAAILATVGLTGSFTWRWRMLVRAISDGHILHWLRTYHFLMLSQLASFLLPKELVDLGGRVLWLKKDQGIPLMKAGISVIWDRCFDLLTVVMFLIGSLPYWLSRESEPRYWWVWLVFCGAPFVGGFFLILGNRFINTARALFVKIITLLYTLPGIRKTPPSIERLSQLPFSLLLKLYCLSIVKFVFLAGQNILFMKALDVPIAPVILLMGTPVSQLAFLFSISPGGLGFLEAGWFSILLFKGVSREYVAVFLIGGRLLLILCMTAIFLIVHIIYQIIGKNVGH